MGFHLVMGVTIALVPGWSTSLWMDRNLEGL